MAEVACTVKTEKKSSIGVKTKTKRYYWLKLSQEYWNGEKMNYLRAMDKGAEYACFWIDLLMLAMNSTEPGVLRYNENLPYTPKALSRITGTDIDTVRVAMEIFQKMGMVVINQNLEIFVPDVISMVGSETDSAKRMRKFRKKMQEIPSQSNTLSSHSDKKTSRCDVEVRV